MARRKLNGCLLLIWLFAGSGAAVCPASGTFQGTAEPSVEQDGRKSDQDAELLRHVPASVRQLLVVRPSRIMNHRDYRELAGKAHDLNRFIGRLTNKYFAFGLARLEDIDALIFATFPAEEKHLDDQRLGPLCNLLILRTSRKHAEGFDMATHAVSEEIDVGGETVFVMRKPINRQFGFAWIADEQTIVWGDRQEAVTAAIASGRSRFRNASWYRCWKPLSDDDVSFAVAEDALKGVAANLPPQLAAAKTLGAMAGSLGVSKKMSATWRGVCANEKDARTLHDAIPGVLAWIKSSLNKQLEFHRETRNDYVSEAEQIPLRIMIDLVSNAAVSRKDSLVNVESTVSLDLDQLAEPLGQLYAASKRTEAANNLRQQALCFHNYHSVMGKFPSPVMVHESGKKYSWRIAILPYIERQDIYDRYDFTQDWDSPHNLEVTSEMPDIFRSDSDDQSSTHTSFFMLSGPGGLFDGEASLDFPEITDGTSNTIMAIEAKRAVHWAKPEDIVIHPDQPLPQFGGFHEGGFNVAMADGSVRFVSEQVAEEVLRHMFTAQGGEVWSPSDLQPPALQPPADAGEEAGGDD